LAFISDQQAAVGLVEDALETMEHYLVLKAVEHPKSRDEALAKIAGVLIEAGQLEEAETIANAIKDEQWKAWVWGYLAVELEAFGQKEKAEEMLKRAVKAAITAQESLERDFRVLQGVWDVLGWALELGWGEAIDIALSEAAALGRSKSLDWVKESLVRLMAEKGLTEKALELAQSIVDPELQAWALVDVAEVIEKTGDKRWAKELFDRVCQISEQNRNSSLLRAVVKAKVRLGEWEEIAKRLEGIDWTMFITNEIDRIEFEAMLGELMQEAIRQGKLSWVREILRECRDVRLKPYALIEFVRALAKLGEEEMARKEFEKAKEWMMKLKDEKERNVALANLVSVIAPLDWVEEIETLLEAIKGEEERKSALELLIHNCKKLEVAEIFAQRLNDYRAWCLVGQRYVEAGQKEKALSAFRKVLQLADRRSVTWVATEMIEAGFFE